MNRNRQEKGITLIALVITIIVLLILAGVSIASLTGEGGILNKATKAKNENNLGTIEEEIKLAYHAVQTDSIIHGWNINKKAEELQKELREQGEEAMDTIVTVFQSDLLISYKGYEVTIHTDGTLEIEDPSLGDKPTGVVTILTTGANVEMVEIQVEASTTDGDIETIEAMNGAIEKENANNTNKKKIFIVSKNGVYYFRIKGTNGRTAVVQSEEITNIIETIEAESLLEGISKLNSSGMKKIKVSGKTSAGEVEEITYCLRMIYSNGDLNLTSTSEINLEGIAKSDSTYTLGSSADLNKNGIVLKVNGNLTIDGTLTTVGGEGSGPLGLYLYCTGNLTNNGTVSMTSKGTISKTENVYLQKNGDEFIYIPKVGGTGSDAIWGATTVGGEGPTTGGTGGGSGAIQGSSYWANAGANGGSYGGGSGGDSMWQGPSKKGPQKNVGGTIIIFSERIGNLRKYCIKWIIWMVLF